VDTTQTTHISLCSGYGGIDLGLRRVIPNLRTVAYAEIEAFACELLLARMEGGQLDAAPIWSDLKSFPWEQFHGLVDILSGGYPCQPFSSAGKRAGADDPRHLWPFISAGIAAMRPSVCFFENVEGHISLGLPNVIEDLAGMGYRTTWGIFSAAEVGSVHQRKRVFILAHRIDQGPQGWLRGWQDTGREDQHGHARCGSAGVHGWWPSRPGQPQHAWEPPRVGGHTSGKRCQQNSTLRNQQQTGGTGQISWEGGGKGLGNAESRDGQWSTQGQTGHAAQPNEGMGNAENNDGRHMQEWSGALRFELTGWRETESALGRSITRTSDRLDYAKLCITCDNRTDELRLLGNGVVPATAEKAFRTLLDSVDPSVHQ